MLTIPRAVHDSLRLHGEETYPHECCGVLLGQFADDGSKTVTRIARAGNTRDDSPHNRYHIDPKELIRIQREARERGEDIVGFYHSHPDHPARWSIHFNSTAPTRTTRNLWMRRLRLYRRS